MSALTTRIFDGSTPNASAAIVAKPVSTPLMSAAPVITVRLPSASRRQAAAAGS